MPDPSQPKRSVPSCTWIVARGLFPYDPKRQKRAAVILAGVALGTTVCVLGVGLIADVGFWLAIVCAILYLVLARERRPRGVIE